MRGIPTAANFSEWKKNWVKDSWVVAFKNEPGKSIPLISDVKRKAVEQYLFLNGLQADSQQFSLYGSFLSENVNVQSIYLDPEKTAASKNASYHFLNVTFKETQFFQESVTQNFAPTFILDKDKEKNKAIQQWASLQANENASWVEPNLFTEVPKIQPQTSDMKLATGSFQEVINGVSAYTKFKDVNPQYKVRIAIVDTGVAYEHPSLAPNMFKNPNEYKEGTDLSTNGKDDDGNHYADDVHGIDATIPLGGSLPGSPGAADVGGPKSGCPEENKTCGHGTHVAGIIAGKYAEPSSVQGICFDRCEIISMRVASLLPNTGPDAAEHPYMDGPIPDDAQIRALQYLNNLKDPDQEGRLLVDVVNMSLGKRFRSRSMGHAVRDIQNGGKVIVVAAAGNEDTDTPSYPGGYASVMTVCSVDRNEAKGKVYPKSSFSNFGYWVDICAPGQALTSTYPPDAIATMGGTSQAAPMVAGAIGFFLSVVGPNRPPPDEVISIFKNAANANALYQPNSYNDLYAARYPDGTKFFLLGSGILDMDAALSRSTTSYVSQEQGDRVKDGCIIHSSIGSARGFSWSHTSSFPFLLFNFFLCLRLHRHFKKMYKI